MLIGLAGANGFLGRAIANRAIEEGHGIRAITRSDESLPFSCERVISAFDDLETAVFRGCDVVVNCAARVHVEKKEDPQTALHLYRRDNRDLAVSLARLARDAQVPRFIQISSVAAVTSKSEKGETVDDATKPRPQRPYGVAKLEADVALSELDGISVVSLRPPALFGEGVGAYFAKLVKAAKLRLPLPLAGFENRRSFAWVGNIADAVLAAANGEGEGAYIITDSDTRSSAALYRQIVEELGGRVFIPKLPEKLARPLFAAVLGDRVDSLIGDAAYDGGRFAADFDWRPQLSFEDALSRTLRSL